MIIDVETYIEEIERLNRELEQERKMSYIHERAAESWRKRYEELAASLPQPKTAPCVRCGKDIVQTPGKPRKLYCGAGCKKAAYRERQLFKPKHKTLLSTLTE